MNIFAAYNENYCAKCDYFIKFANLNNLCGNTSKYIFKKS